MTDTERPMSEREKKQDTLNHAVLYALKSGCFFPVPVPTLGATVDELIQWGAMRHLHKAIAEFYRS